MDPSFIRLLLHLLPSASVSFLLTFPRIIHEAWLALFYYDWSGDQGKEANFWCITVFAGWRGWK